ncbi:DMT family protein [Tropicimonas sp. IMCC34043]|uniref:DMT family protein n=1 Tax=Tropicimonas sp. IMCC34043 TaxID=2248760 RepID=UPI000E2411B3|nr:DMT family protein [Tropicimonas sp. IMCC34043]
MLNAVLRPGTWPYVAPILLLLASNVFMTFAWYWHLKFKSMALWSVVLISWSIALMEYSLAVPANRIGHSVYSAAQLKTIQEVLALTIFTGFSVFYLRESLSWNILAGFALIVAGAALVFKG